MEIKEAIKFIKNSPPEIEEDNGDDFEKFTEANLAILNAIYNGGYTLCKVDEAIEKSRNMNTSERKESVWDSGEITANTAMERCVNIIKEACV